MSKQADGAGHHPLAGQSLEREVRLEGFARRAQRSRELGKALELLAVALGAPVVVVEVLPPPGGVGPDRLDVAAIVSADPDVLPSRRDDERLDALHGRLVRDRVAAFVAVREAAAAADSAIARPRGIRSAGAWHG